MRQHTRRTIRLCGLNIGLIVVSVVARGTAVAGVGGPRLTLSPTSASAGGRITASGSGFSPNEAVSIFTPQSPLVTAIVSPNGAFPVALSVPTTAPKTAHGVLAFGQRDDYGHAVFFVVPPSGPPAPSPAPTNAPLAPPSRNAVLPTQAPPSAMPAPRQPLPTPAATSTPVPTLTPTATPVSGSSGQACATTPEQTQAEQSVLGLLNQHRVAAGAPPLQLNATVSEASHEHSCDMFEHQQLNHDGSDGSSFAQRIGATGVGYSTAGENIGMAAGDGLGGGIDAIDNGMMSEPLSDGTHRWNILNAAYTQIGLGCIFAGGQVWLTEDFIG